MTNFSLSNQKLNLTFPTNVTKAPSYDYVHDWNERLAQEGINWTSLVTFLDTDFIEKHKSLDYCKIDSSCSGDEVKVPSITHRVYISLEGSTKFLSDIDIKTTEHSLIKLNLVHDHWQHYFWTNNADNVDPRIKAIPGIKIMDFSEFSDHLLYNIAMGLMEKAKINSKPAPLLTQIADIFRLLAMQKYGGIYMDNNVVIIDPFKFYEVTKKFSIALTQEGGEEHNDKNDPSLVTKVEQKDVANNIIIATPDHEVINDTIDLALRNFGQNETAPPLYVSRGPDLSNNLAYEAGPCALSIGFFNYVNKQILLGEEGSNDFIFYRLGGLSHPFYAKCIRKAEIERGDVLNQDPELAEYLGAPDCVPFVTIDGYKLFTIAADPLGAAWITPEYAKPLQYYYTTDLEGKRLECGPWKVLPGDLTPSDYVLSLSGETTEEFICGYLAVSSSASIEF